MQPIGPLRYLTQSEIEQIHAASVRLCAEMGMKIANEKLLAALGSAGAQVEADVAKFPPEMVQWAIDTAPKDLTLYGRAGQVLHTGGGRTDKYPCNHTNSVKMLDYRATSLRDSTLQDIINAARIADGLDNCARVGTPCYPWDVPTKLRELRFVEAMLTNTSKHLVEAPQTVFELDLWCEALELVTAAPLPEKPVIDITISPRSPMAISGESAEMVLACISRRLPVLCAPCPMAGGTSPYTLAGTIMQQNAESLCMITMIQLLAEGCPIICGGAAGPLDMRTGSLSYGAQERNLTLGASMDLARWYGFPNYSPAGSVDSPWIDVQIGIEKMATMLTRVLSPAQMTPGFGAVYNGLAISLEQMVIDSEIYDFCLRIARGIEVSEETLALDAILRVGHAGQFLMDEHTLQYMRNEDENLLPELSNRDGDTGTPMLEAAHEKVEKILAEHKPELDSTAIEKIRTWADEKSKELAK